MRRSTTWTPTQSSRWTWISRTLPRSSCSSSMQWRKGNDVVLGRRSDRSSDSLLKRWSAGGFYAVINAISDTPVPSDVGDFRLMDRRVVEVIRALPERNRFMKGLFAWVGFSTATVDYARRPRSAGGTSWSSWRLWNFALDGITGFSTVPLRVWTYIGVLIAAGCLAFSALIVVLQVTGNVIAISGYASLIVAVLFVGSIQLISLGLIGEYFARMMAEAKRRPVYVVDDISRATTRPTGGDASMDLKEEEILGDRVGEHWYYRSKSLALHRLLEPFLSMRARCWTSVRAQVSSRGNS